VTLSEEERLEFVENIGDRMEAVLANVERDSEEEKNFSYALAVHLNEFLARYES
jgi:hypothetical protein